MGGECRSIEKDRRAGSGSKQQNGRTGSGNIEKDCRDRSGNIEKDKMAGSGSIWAGSAEALKKTEEQGVEANNNTVGLGVEA